MLAVPYKYSIQLSMTGVQSMTNYDYVYVLHSKILILLLQTY
jgi:hypothetical protein